MSVKLENRFFLEMREQKQTSAKVRSIMMKTMQKESNIHSKIKKQLDIGEQELERDKISQKEYENTIKHYIRENPVMKAEVLELRNKNDS